MFSFFFHACFCQLASIWLQLHCVCAEVVGRKAAVSIDSPLTASLSLSRTHKRTCTKEFSLDRQRIVCVCACASGDNAFTAQKVWNAIRAGKKRRMTTKWISDLNNGLSRGWWSLISLLWWQIWYPVWHITATSHNVAGRWTKQRVVWRAWLTNTWTIMTITDHVAEVSICLFIPFITSNYCFTIIAMAVFFFLPGILIFNTVYRMKIYSFAKQQQKK